MNKKITLGIIVYNNFPFLAELMYEINEQVKLTPKLLEEMNFILVDDCSTNPELIKYYETLPAFFTFKRFTENSGGPSRGRNYIIDHAKSDKLFFIDGDDTIVGSLWRIVEEINAFDADIYMSDVTKILTDGRRELSPFYFSKKIFDVQKPFQPHADLYKVIVHQTGIWSVYDVAFLRRNDIKYQESVRYEDNYFLAQVLLAEPRIHILKEKYYGWRMNYVSFTNTFESLHERVAIYQKMLTLLEDHQDKAIAPWLFYSIWNQTYVNLARVYPYIKDRKNFTYYLKGLCAVTKQHQALVQLFFAKLDNAYIDIYTKFVKLCKFPLFWLIIMRTATRIRDRKKQVTLFLLSLLRILPVNKKKIIFTSHYGDYNDNSKYLYLKMKQDAKYKNYRFVFAVKERALYMSNKDFINYQNRFLFFFHHYTAQQVFFNSWYNPNIKKRKGQIWTQLWHGVPLKKIHTDINVYNQTFSLRQQAERQRSIDKWDYAYTLNRHNTAIFHRLFPNVQCIERIYFKTEWLLENRDNQTLIQSLRKKHQLVENAVLFAPTYRPYKVYFDYAEIFKYVNQHEKLYVHLHPLMRAEFGNAQACEGREVEFLEAIDDIQEIILCTAKVITDYSSIAYDYAKMQKVVQYYCPDQAVYDQIHGLYHEKMAEMLQ